MDDELNLSWLNDLETPTNLATDPINQSTPANPATNPQAPPTDENITIECQPTIEIQYIFIN